MTRPVGPPVRTVVALRLGDAGRRKRVADEIAATAELVLSDGAADLVIVDEARWLPETTQPVVLVGEADPAALPHNVRALLPADAGARTIVSAARLVAEGLLILPEGALFRSAEAEREDDEAAEPPSVRLTPREQEVLKLLAAGASNKRIARALDVSVHTAKFHVASLLRKLGASGRLDAVGIGLRTGLLMV